MDKKYKITDNIEIEAVQYSLEFESKPRFQKVSITPVITIDSTEKCSMIANLKVDNHELLPSAKFTVEAGSNRKMLPAVYIMRRKAADASFDEHPSAYDMELKLIKSMDNYVVIKQKIDLKESE